MSVFEQLDVVAGDRSWSVLDRVVAVSREMLEMDFACIAALTEEAQVHVKVAGDATSFGAPGATPIETTICGLMVDGRVPNVIPDTHADRAVRDLPVVRDHDIGSYAGVPIRFSDGHLYGSLSCLGHESDPALADRDIAFMRVLARIAADHLEREELRVAHEQERLETVARIAHDLRSPLQAIYGFAELMKKGHADGTYAETISREALRLNAMVDELLAEPVKGTLLARNEFDLVQASTEQVELFQAQSARHELQLSGATEAQVVGDRARTLTVLANLLSNAIKYSPKGGPVAVTIEPRHGAVRTTVRDIGLGIPEHLQAAIFTRFFRVETEATAAINGTGLGLALLRDGVRAQGGEVGFTSAEAKGSSFWFELPAT